jgi:hypothetical protein
MTRTLTLTSPLQRGQDVKLAQAKLILGGWLRKGGNDGVYGPETSRAAGQAHWWLGFPTKLAKAETYGEVLDRVLTQWLADKTLPADYQQRRVQRLKAVTLGTKALDWLRTKVGETEQPPGSNQIEWATGWYGMVGPWCAMAVTRAYVEAGSTAFARGQRWAYVPYIVASARAGRDGLNRTFDVQAGDLFCVNWGGTGGSNSVYNFDHVGLVDRPPATLTAGAQFATIEGNTSFGDLGDQSNGGAVAARTRTIIGGGSTVFVRVTR